MTSSKSQTKRVLTAEIKQGIYKRAIQIGGTVLFMALVLFLGSGRPDWEWAWVYLGFYVLGVMYNAIVLYRTDPGLIAERGEPKEGTKSWDYTLTRLSLPIWLAALLVPALDERNSWSPDLPLAIHIASLAATILGNAFLFWAMRTNTFFSTQVRIQDDRGQTVVSDGPYRFVRHPGYTGLILGYLTFPLILGSLWGLVPALLLITLIIYRTTLEDRTLHEELKGYAEYAVNVRHRLVPGIW